MSLLHTYLKSCRDVANGDVPSERKAFSNAGKCDKSQIAQSGETRTTVCFPPCGIHTVVTLQKLVESGENPCKMTCIVTWHVRKLFCAVHRQRANYIIVFLHLHQISASAARISRAVWAPREVRQPHCQMRFEKAWDNPFVLGSLGDVLQGIHFLMLCQVPSPRRVATSLVFFVGKTNTERYYLPPHPPRYPPFHAYLYPRMLKCVGLRISIHVWYAEARGFAHLYPRMLQRVGLCVWWWYDDDWLTWCVSRLAWRPKKTKIVKK